MANLNHISVYIKFRKEKKMVLQISPLYCMVFEKLPTSLSLIHGRKKQDPSPGTLYNETIELSIIALPLEGKFGTAVDC